MYSWAISCGVGVPPGTYQPATATHIVVIARAAVTAGTAALPGARQATSAFCTIPLTCRRDCISLSRSATFREPEGARDAAADVIAAWVRSGSRRQASSRGSTHQYSSVPSFRQRPDGFA